MRAAYRGLVLRGTGSLSLHCDDAARRLVASLISNDALGLYQDHDFNYKRSVVNADNIVDVGKGRQASCSLLEFVEDSDDSVQALAQLGQRSMDKNVGYSTLMSYDGLVLRKTHKEASAFGTACSHSSSSRRRRRRRRRIEEGYSHGCSSSSMFAQAAQARRFSCFSTRESYISSDTNIAIVSKVLRERYASTDTRGNRRERKDTDNDDNNGGWTYEEIVNIPNALSAARLVSGPIIGTLILNGEVRCVNGIPYYCIMACAAGFMDLYVCLAVYNCCAYSGCVECYRLA